MWYCPCPAAVPGLRNRLNKGEEDGAGGGTMREEVNKYNVDIEYSKRRTPETNRRTKQKRETSEKLRYDL